jgi:hypothetical protein
MKKSAQQVKRVRYINADLHCLRRYCRTTWAVRDLNPERKAVPCPACGSETDIKEGLKNAHK